MLQCFVGRFFRRRGAGLSLIACKTGKRSAEPGNGGGTGGRAGPWTGGGTIGFFHGWFIVQSPENDRQQDQPEFSWIAPRWVSR